MRISIRNRAELDSLNEYLDSLNIDLDRVDESAGFPVIADFHHSLKEPGKVKVCLEEGVYMNFPDYWNMIESHIRARWTVVG